jgi:hypothetical protein
VNAKNDLTSKKRPPPGILSNAASFAGLKISVMKSFMDNNGDKLVVDLFKDYVNKNFTSIADFLKQRNTLSASESSSSLEEQQEEFRTFSISLKKILRKDLPEEIENIIKTKIEASL